MGSSSAVGSDKFHEGDLPTEIESNYQAIIRSCTLDSDALAVSGLSTLIVFAGGHAAYERRSQHAKVYILSSRISRLRVVSVRVTLNGPILSVAPKNLLAGMISSEGSRRPMWRVCAETTCRVGPFVITPSMAVSVTLGIPRSW